MTLRRDNVKNWYTKIIIGPTGSFDLNVHEKLLIEIFAFSVLVNLVEPLLLGL